MWGLFPDRSLHHVRFITLMLPRLDGTFFNHINWLAGSIDYYIRTFNGRKEAVSYIIVYFSDTGQAVPEAPSDLRSLAELDILI